VSTLVPLLAHGGSPNNPWIGVMTVSAWVLLAIFALHVARRLELDAPGDLLLPLAAVVLIAGLTGSLGDTISDQGPWAVPAGLVVLVALVWAAFGDVDFAWGQRRTFAVLGIAVVAAAALYSPLEDLWFPTDDADEVLLPVPDDVEVAAEVVEPLDDEGRFAVRVTLQGASFNDNQTVTGGDDPEEGVVPKFPVGSVVLNPTIPEACAAQDRCTEAVFQLTLPPGLTDDPPSELEVELLTADGRAFAPPVLAEYALEGAAAANQ
jgi:hypothetical protein